MGMYGIPFFYGMFLRYFHYGKCFLPNGHSTFFSSSATQKPPSFAAALDVSVASAIQSIAKLGGYMIFFNLLNLLPQLAFSAIASVLESSVFDLCSLSTILLRLQIFSGLFLEITGGITLSNGTCPVLMLSMLQFGGLSCLAQTYSMISDTDISLSSYLFHKSIQGMLAFIYYTLLFQFCS